MKTKLLLLTLLSSGVTIFAAFSMRDPAALHLMSPKPATSGMPTGGLLVDYVADPVFFNADWATTGIQTWAPSFGDFGTAILSFRPDWGSPATYSATDYDGKPCVEFSSSLMQAPFAYTGQSVTYVYCGDFRSDFGTGIQGGYPRLAGLANYGLGEEDYGSSDCGIFLYSTDSSTWNSLRSPDVFSLGGLAANPDEDFRRVILVEKQDGTGHWLQHVYFPDGSTLSGSTVGTLNNYNTDTLNVGGNTEPNLGVFNLAEFAIYDHALSTADEAAAVAYLKSIHW